MTSPCMSCSTAPCCSHLEIYVFSLRNAKDLDQALYFSNFSNIETSLNNQWQCSVYLRSQCRHLSAESGCQIHNQPEQPLVCVNYSPYACFFKPNMADKQHSKPGLIWMNSQRWQELTPALNLDSQNCIQYPQWENLCSFMAQIEYTPKKMLQETEPVMDAPYANWLIWREGQTPAPDQQVLSLEQYRNVCANCSSWCCTHLSVPFKTPTQFKDIDYIRYCLNFPGTQIVVSDRGWALMVKTRCSHLKDNRCSIYDQPERPHICRYYPEQDCYYRKTTAKTRPDNYLRLAKEEFDLVPELFRFNSEGKLLHTPDPNQLRAAVEEKLGKIKLDEQAGVSPHALN